MSVFKSKEVFHKIERIRQLADVGLNTPRMYHLFPDDDILAIRSAIRWAQKIHEEEPQQVFNVRTYRTSQGLEEKNTPHITNIEFDNLPEVINEYIQKHYVCMIDAETPENGRWAGNIIIHNQPGYNKGVYEIDYCTKPVRAMVRDADQHKTGNIQFIQGTLATPLAMVVGSVLQSRMFDNILEWTLFEGSAGVKREPLVFWEYRAYA